MSQQRDECSKGIGLAEDTLVESYLFKEDMLQIRKT